MSPTGALRDLTVADPAHHARGAAQPQLDLSVLDELATKRIQFGVLDLRDAEVESVELVAERIRRALDHVEADRLVIAPDCGCKYLSRAVAQGKVDSMVKAAALVRGEVS